MWFIIFLVLALAAYFIVKAVKAQAQRKQAVQDRLSEGSGLAGSLSHDNPADSAATNGIIDSQTPAKSSGQATAVAQGATANAVNTATSVATNATDDAADAASRAVSAAGEAAHAISEKGVAAAAAVGAIAAGAGSAAGTASQSLSTGNPLHDIQEMIKILNLAEPDASRLAISREEFAAIRNGNDSQMPSAESLSAVADKLQQMLA